MTYLDIIEVLNKIDNSVVNSNMKIHFFKKICILE